MVERFCHLRPPRPLVLGVGAGFLRVAAILAEWRSTLVLLLKHPTESAGLGRGPDSRNAAGVDDYGTFHD